MTGTACALVGTWAAPLARLKPEQAHLRPPPLHRCHPAPGRWSRSFYLFIYFISPAGGLGLVPQREDRKRPRVSFRRVCCLSSKTMCLCLCALIHINDFTTWAESSSRCLKMRFQCQLRGALQARLLHPHLQGSWPRGRQPLPDTETCV